MDTHQSYQFPFASFPAVRLALLLSSGIIADFYLDPQALLWFSLLALFTSCFGICQFFHQKTLRIGLYHLTLLFYLSSAICFGGGWHALFNNQDAPSHAELVNTYIWKDLNFSGEVYQIKPTGAGKYQIDIEVDSTTFPNQFLWENTYNLRGVLNPDEIPFPANLQLGDRIKFCATIYPLNEPTNPHEFDYKGFLASQKIYIQAGLKAIYQIKKQKNFINWNSIRQNVLNAIDRNFSSQTAPLAKALLIGDKHELSRDTKVAFSRAGLSHIMAVSGLHVGFILAPFWIIIPFFWGFRGGKKMGLTILITVLFFYAGLTGFSPSVTRASLAGGLLAYGRLFHKVSNAKNLTAVAALIILVLNPRDLFSIGFQLSFGAVYIILLVAPVVNRLLPDRIRFRWYGTPIMVVIISLIVQVGLYPLLAFYFGEFSIIGPLANAFVVPFLGIALPYALLVLPLTLVWPTAAQILTIPIDYFLYALHHFVTTTAGWHWSWIQVHIDSPTIFALWITIIFFIAAIPISKLRWKILALCLFILVLKQGQKLSQKFQTPELEITVFDVGQGDATLVSTATGKHYLIDTGPWQPGYNSAKYVIIPYLKAEGIAKLDGIFLSHPHADHIGGVKELLKTIPIDTIYNSGSRYTSNLFYDYQKIAKQQDTPIVSLKSGQQLPLDAFTPLFIYGPAPKNTPSPNVNNRSLILEIVYGKTEFLFMGDAERSQENQLTQRYPQLIDTDFLKVGHHGSKTSSSQSLLKAASPKIGVVSLNLRNRFHHPHRKAIMRLRQDSIQLHFTSLDGAIKLYSNGNNIRTVK